MKIEYFGHACFRTTANDGLSLLTDPYTKVGYELPSGLQADIVTVSHGHFDHNATHLVSTNTLLDKAGVYELNVINLQGISSYHDEQNGTLRGGNILFKWEMDGLVLCHLGDLGERLSLPLLEKIGKVDVLFIPVGGKYTIDALQAKEYVQALAPSIVIPMHYKPQDGTIDITDEKSFLQLFENVERVGDSAVELSQKDLTHKQTKIIFMERIRG